MTERTTGKLTRCSVHGVYHKDDEPCAKCEMNLPGTTGAVVAADRVRSSRFPIAGVTLLVVVGTIGTIAVRVSRSGAGDAGVVRNAPPLTREPERLGLVPLARFESRVRTIETAAFESSGENYDVWRVIEPAAEDIMTLLEDARTIPERQALIEITAFLANLGNRIELGGADIETVRREWAGTRGRMFGSVSWFHPAPAMRDNVDGSFFSGDVTAAHVAALRDWALEVQRILNLGMNQSRRIGEIGPEGETPGSGAAARIAADWNAWTLRWFNSLAELRRKAPPMPVSDARATGEYIELHQMIGRAIGPMESVGYTGGTYGVPSQESREAYFREAESRLGDLAPAFERLRAVVGTE